MSYYRKHDCCSCNSGCSKGCNCDKSKNYGLPLPNVSGMVECINSDIVYVDMSSASTTEMEFNDESVKVYVTDGNVSSPSVISSIGGTFILSEYGLDTTVPFWTVVAEVRAEVCGQPVSATCLLKLEPCL